MVFVDALRHSDAAARAEMRRLGLKPRTPYPALLFCLLAAADTASVVMTLSAL